VIRGLRVPVYLSSREALRIFDIADIWAARTGHTVRLVSANDHVHSRRSAHYSGLALDLHSSHPAGLAEALRLAGYRVLWNVPGHYGHVHAEYSGPSGFSPRPLLLPRLLMARSQSPPAAAERRRAVGG
jgi:hypothetical protein